MDSTVFCGVNFDIGSRNAQETQNTENGERLLIDRTIAIFGLILVAIPVVAELFIGRWEKSLTPKERAAWQAERVIR